MPHLSLSDHLYTQKNLNCKIPAVVCSLTVVLHRLKGSTLVKSTLFERGESLFARRKKRTKFPWTKVQFILCAVSSVPCSLEKGIRMTDIEEWLKMCYIQWKVQAQTCMSSELNRSEGKTPLYLNMCTQIMYMDWKSNIVGNNVHEKANNKLHIVFMC